MLRTKACGPPQLLPRGKIKIFYTDPWRVVLFGPVGSHETFNARVKEFWWPHHVREFVEGAGKSCEDQPGKVSLIKS